VTHIKEALIPHPSGKTARESIMGELRELEAREDGRLGVKFIEVKKGDRICKLSAGHKQLFVADPGSDLRAEARVVYCISSVSSRGRSGCIKPE